MKPHFLVHNGIDTVDVAVAEDIKQGQALTGRVMDTDATIRVKTRDHVPLGHKIALGDMKTEQTVLEYGHDIGGVVAAIRKGDHGHLHNEKTERPRSLSRGCT